MVPRGGASRRYPYLTIGHPILDGTKTIIKMDLRDNYGLVLSSSCPVDMLLDLPLDHQSVAIKASPCRARKSRVLSDCPALASSGVTVHAYFPLGSK